MNKKQRESFLANIKTLFDPTYREFEVVVSALDLALAKPVKTNKIRNTKAPSLMSLQEWEDKKSTQLSALMFGVWARDKGISIPVLASLIEEFRLEMMSKNKQYACFGTAFQVYLTKGYLSKSLYQAQLESGRTAATSINRRGGDL